MTATAGNGERFAAAPLVDGGTPASVWLTADPLPLLDLDECPCLVVVTPHPDDETLGLGATMAHLAARGVEVAVVSVTDGGAAFPGASSVAQAELEATRRDELYLATRLLGVSQPITLGLPDGGLVDQEDRLASLLAGILHDKPAGTWCAATWRGDGHPDHEVVGRAAAQAVEATGAILVEYPIWMWHWADPDDDDVPWERAVRLPLPATVQAQKRAAIAAFVSQVLPVGSADADAAILPPHVVARFDRAEEVFFL